MQMKITVEVTEQELKEMNCDVGDLKTIICNDLDDFYSEYYVEIIVND